MMSRRIISIIKDAIVFLLELFVLFPLLLIFRASMRKAGMWDDEE